MAAFNVAQLIDRLASAFWRHRLARSPTKREVVRSNPTDATFSNMFGSSGFGNVFSYIFGSSASAVRASGTYLKNNVSFSVW